VVLVALVVFLKLDFYHLFLAYVIVQAFTFFALFTDVFRLKIFEFGSIDFKLGKELVKFSIPLMLTGISGFIMTRTSTLMLGYYKTSEVVG